MYLKIGEMLMSKSQRQLLERDRYRLQNPYAHVDEMDEIRAEEERRRSIPGSELFHDARENSQNPYYGLDGEGRIADGNGPAESGTPLFEHVKKPGRYGNQELEAAARKLQVHLWRNRRYLWKQSISNPIDALDIKIALSCLGYEYHEVEGLDQGEPGKQGLDVAAVLEPANRRVFVSRQSSAQVRRFTGAHELGHAVLHDVREAVHRDRGVDGSRIQRDPIEWEADKFASFFLMPEKLIKERFMANFGLQSFVLNELTAFALGSSLDVLEDRCRSLRDLSKLLAGCEQFNGSPIVSLVSRFKVSVPAMAIRLEELDLVKWPS